MSEDDKQRYERKLTIVDKYWSILLIVAKEVEARTHGIKKEEMPKKVEAI